MARFQSENRVSCQVTVGVGVTGIDVSSTCTYFFFFLMWFNKEAEEDNTAQQKDEKKAAPPKRVKKTIAKNEYLFSFLFSGYSNISGPPFWAQDVHH